MDPVIEPDPGWIRVMIHLFDFDPSFARIDRCAHAVDIPCDNHFSTLSLQICNSSFKSVQKVEFVRSTAFVCFVRAVEIEENKESDVSATESKRPTQSREL